MENATRWDGRMMDLATMVSTWSKDPSTKVGAVITDNQHRVLGIGFNGLPRGVPDINLDDRNYRLPRTVHAEINAILNASSTRGAILYVTLPPCADCAAVIRQAGIHRVVYQPAPPEFSLRWDSSVKVGREILEAPGPDQVALIAFTGER